MKNINYVINGVLAVAVIVLFILQFTGSGRKVGSSIKATDELTGEGGLTIPVAYVYVDSLMEKYFFAIDLYEQITKKSENTRASFNQQYRAFESEVERFQYTVQNNGFTSQQRAEQEQRRLQQRQAELQALDEKLSMELMEENQKLNNQLRDTIMTHLKEYNSAKGYQIIFGNSSANLVNPILLADDVYNITNEVIDFLNKKWSSMGH
jgi:outer membrane protein